MTQDPQLKELYQAIEAGERITPDQGLFLLEKASWLELGQLAQQRRIAQIGAGWASYTMFRIINYTNICNIDCTFCSFKKNPGEQRAYVMPVEEVLQATQEAHDRGADQIFFQGGVNPALGLDYYLEALSAVKERFGCHIRGFSPVELRDLAKSSGVPLPDLIRQLKEAGLDSVPGAGAEILAERVRDLLSPKKCSPEEWALILGECHQMGLGGSANIVIGSVETQKEVIGHLELVRQVQDQTGGFSSFIPWTFQPQTKDFPVQKIPHHQYLKLLALCRLYLDNILNIEVSVMVLGPEIGKLALHMGANDISSPVLEENVLRSHGLATEEQARKLIEDAELTPRRRDFNYNFRE
ncbi:MAG: CofH family radical SAM protein [bacterium]|nr:CofH family radical SAM protein [bacterium]